MVRCEISVSLYSRPASAAPYPAKCFAVAKIFCWNPRTRAAAMSDPRYGSSPEPSAMRPQRGSRAMSTIGAYVQLIPNAAASCPAARAVASAASGSNELASPSGIGKIVRYPWITSSPNSSGILSRDSVTAMRWTGVVFSAPMTLKSPPSLPARRSSICCGDARPFADSKFSWPSFSSRVMRARRESRFCAAAALADSERAARALMQRCNIGRSLRELDLEVTAQNATA